uniref:flowering time control protein FPA-like n=1 Tax=Erigeron canadensis TaxID=72917 RepID=UPI001CB92F7A|nr:flowering time control protein FPA-like [Erigeron canadensis]XP_043610768.1 flowering time control protein FPA-like [Erigeron canadensis]
MSNNLWVGSLAGDVTETELRKLFEKHGGVDSVCCYPSRNYAFVYLNNADDAKKARDNLQGVVVHGIPLKIEFAKPAKPCKSLWVSGISSSISKEDLLEEFSKFGKIKDFKFQSDKNVAYIDYFRLEDATKAVKAMHGQYKGGSVIRVDYSRSHSRKDILSSEGRKGDEEQPSNVLCVSYPSDLDIDEQMLHNAMILFGEIEKIKSFPSKYRAIVEFRSIEEAQQAKNGLQGKLFNDPRIEITFSTEELSPNQYLNGTRGPMPNALFKDFPFQAPQFDVIGPSIVSHSFHGRVRPLVGADDSYMHPFAPQGSFDSILPGQGISGPDPYSINPVSGLNWRPSNQILSLPSASINPLTKSASRTRDVFDASQNQRQLKRFKTDGPMPLKETNDRVLRTDHLSNPQTKGSNLRFQSVNPNIDRPGVYHIWRGIIAKGGTPVCCARCVPVGDWIGYEIPEIVNCSARTGLDTLAKHYADAIGFDLVYFLPDSEEDFASYTEFLRYMGDRNRAGVVKFVDGTTLFLVPPSDFLTMVLKVSGPDRLYGVVLNFPKPVSNNVSGPSISQPQYNDNLQVPLSSNPQPVHSVQSIIATPTTSVGLSLTPELIATLASLSKVNSNGHQPLGTLAGPVLNEKNFQGQISENETSKLTGHFTQKQTYPSNTTNASNLAVIRDSHIHDPSFSLSHNQATASMTSSSYQTPQGVQFELPVQAAQQYQLDNPQDLNTDTSSVFHRGVNGVTSSNQVIGVNFNEAQSMVSSGMHLPEQLQQLQPGLKGASQQKLEFDANKNERYQSTLQFAANLLLQIHQKRSGTETGKGNGNR